MMGFMIYFAKKGVFLRFLRFLRFFEKWSELGKMGKNGVKNLSQNPHLYTTVNNIASCMKHLVRGFVNKEQTLLLSHCHILLWTGIVVGHIYYGPNLERLQIVMDRNFQSPERAHAS